MSAVMFQPRAGFSRKTVANQISRSRFLWVHQSERGDFGSVAAAVSASVSWRKERRGLRRLNPPDVWL